MGKARKLSTVAIILVLGFGLGWVASVGREFVTHSSERLTGIRNAGFWYRARVVTDLYCETGSLIFKSCNEKVEDLHKSIETSSRTPDEFSRLVLSVALDDESCIDPLVGLLSSSNPLPSFSFFVAFDLGGAGENLGASMGTERELAIFLLDQIDGGRTRSRVFSDCALTTPEVWQQCQEELANEWRFLSSSGPSSD